MKAVVTGAASGLGNALCLELVGRGASVIGIDLAGGERADVIAASGATYVPCDVTNQGDWERAAASVLNAFGTVDLLALNAGVMTRSPTDAIDDDPLSFAGSAAYRRVFAVNVDGVVFGLSALRPLLANGSAVVATASTAGLGGLSFDPFYSASKHAVVGLVRSLGAPLAAAGVRFNALCPGGINTAIVPDAFRSMVPPDSFRPPSDVAKAILAVADQQTVGGTWTLSDDEHLVCRYDVPDIAGRSNR
jgi:NAD(P)-dependent dehydrogenase (short-subunit alcohol dehydrogenase family)